MVFCKPLDPSVLLEKRERFIVLQVASIVLCLQFKVNDI